MRSYCSYIYDADGNRLITKDSVGVTVYLSGYELRKVGSTVSCTRYIGSSSRTAGGLTWIAADHHGTGQLAIDATTLTTTRRKIDPFGNPRGADPAWPNPKGFVGRTRDNTGLTHLGAREYEPATGRFVSDDRIADAGDPQQLNGYSYANNRPLTSSDPSGLWTDHDKTDSDAWEGDCTLFNTKNCAQDGTGGSRNRSGETCPAMPKGKCGPPLCTNQSCNACENTHGGNPDCATPEQLKLKDEWDNEVFANQVTCLLILLLVCGLSGSHGIFNSYYEQAWCLNAGAAVCGEAMLAWREAAAVEKSLLGEQGWLPEDANAVKHAYWMARMASRGIPEEQALALGFAHEIGAYQIRKFEGGDPNIDLGQGDSNVDLHNNWAGYQLGRRYAQTGTENELKQAVMNSVYDRPDSTCVQLCTYAWHNDR